MIATLLLAAFLAANANAFPTSAIDSGELQTHLSAAERDRALCGPLSLWICLRRLGRSVTAARVIEEADASVSDKGISFDELLRLSQRYVEVARAVDVEDKDVESLPTPAILVLHQSHCVVYLGIDPATGKARIVDPSRRITGLEPLELVRKHWSGEAIVFRSQRLSLSSWIGINLSAAAALLFLVSRVLALHNCSAARVTKADVHDKRICDA